MEYAYVMQIEQARYIFKTKEAAIDSVKLSWSSVKDCKITVEEQPGSTITRVKVVTAANHQETFFIYRGDWYETPQHL